MNPKPFLKWAGGKSDYADTILSLFPKEIHTYHEPFVGGGSILLALLMARKNGTIRIHGTIYASDVNSTLIGLYKNIQTCPREVIREAVLLLNEMKSGTEPTSCVYYRIRSTLNGLTPIEKMSVKGSSMFLVLNKTCFRGLYREGPHGFNVPYGNYKNPVLDEANILLVSSLIQDVVFTHTSFTTIRIDPDDLVYLDPPYAPESPSSFVSYTYGGFTLQDHHALFKLCHSLKKSSFVLSNSDVGMVRNEFPPPYTTITLSCRRAIHSKNPGTRTNELLITNIDANARST